MFFTAESFPFLYNVSSSLKKIILFIFVFSISMSILLINSQILPSGVNLLSTNSNIFFSSLKKMTSRALPHVPRGLVDFWVCCSSGLPLLCSRLPLSSTPGLSLQLYPGWVYPSIVSMGGKFLKPFMSENVFIPPILFMC